MDWVGYPLLLLQIYLFSTNSSVIRSYLNPKSLGFLIGMLACVALFCYGIQIRSIPMIIANYFMFLFNYRGFNHA